MNDELPDDIKKKFRLPLQIELQDHKEKVFHNAPVSSEDTTSTVGEFMITLDSVL